MKTVFLLLSIAALSFGSSYTPADVKQAFLDNKIVPDVLEIAPKKIINVWFESVKSWYFLKV